MQEHKQQHQQSKCHGTTPQAFLMNLMSWPKNAMPFFGQHVIVCRPRKGGHIIVVLIPAKLSGDNRASNAINIYGIF